MPTAVVRRFSLLLITVALTVGACGDDRVAAPPAADLGGPLLIDPVPPGLEVVGMQRGELTGFFEPDFGQRPLEVYGSPGDDPFTDPVYVVTTHVPRDDEPIDEYLEGMRAWGRQPAEAGEVNPDEGRTVEVGGVEGVMGRAGGPHEGLLEVVWPSDPDTLLVVASSRASADELEAVAGHVSLGDDGRSVVAATAGLDRIGGLGPDVAERSSRTSFGVATSDNLQGVSVVPITPEEQVAYRALMTEDPAQEYRTTASCCDPNLLHPPRRLEVDGKEAHIGTVTTRFRALVVGGDPGVVLLSGGDRLASPHADGELVAMAENLRPATVDEVDAIVEDHREEQTEASYERVAGKLAGQCPGVEPIGRVEVRDRSVVLAAGSCTERGIGDGPEPHICAQYFGEVEFGLGCIGRTTWDGADVAAVGFYEGLIVVGDERLASVSLASPGAGEIEGTVLPLDLGPDHPSRIGFVYAEVELQADPEVDTQSVAVVARDAAGQELLRARVRDLPST